MHGAESLLGKYIEFLVDHFKETISHTGTVLTESHDSFLRATFFISKDILGKLMLIVNSKHIKKELMLPI